MAALGEVSHTSSLIAFIDSEVGIDDGKIHDLGAVRTDGSTFHSASAGDFARFIAGCDYVCGHNIIHHDLPHIASALRSECACLKARRLGHLRLNSASRSSLPGAEKLDSLPAARRLMRLPSMV